MGRIAFNNTFSRGLLDGVCVFGRTLTDAAIARLAAGGSCGDLEDESW
jgi:hypothetical protein